MIATIKKELVSKIYKNNDEILLRQISLMLENDLEMKLNIDEINAIDKAFIDIKNNELYSNESVQSEWNEWIEK